MFFGPDYVDISADYLKLSGVRHSVLTPLFGRKQGCTLSHQFPTETSVFPHSECFTSPTSSSFQLSATTGHCRFLKS